MLLTFSLLLLVMALGFVFGRVVVARAYVKASDSLHKPPGTTVPAGAATVGTQPAPEGATETPTAPESGADQQEETSPAGDEGAAGGAPATDEGADSTSPGDAGGADTQGGGNASEVRYAIQVGAFDSEQSARRAETQLTGAGYAARIATERQRGRTTYKVFTGRYRTEENAQQALADVKREGYSGAFVVEEP